MFNHATFEIIGHVGRSETKNVNGTKFAVLSIATNDRYTDKKTNERREVTNWHRVITFSPKLIAVIENHVGEGDFVKVNGTIKQNKYDKDGETKYSTDLHVNRIGFLSPKTGDQDAADE